MDESARSVAHHLKYGGWPRVAESLAAVMAPMVESTPGSVLVPVPLSAGRLRRRGYNQAQVLARALGERIGLPVKCDRVKRVRETTTQTALAPEARQANVTGAFVASGRVDSRVILVDDVFTTGATLLAVAQALFEGGAKAVGAVTFARAVPPLG